MRAHAIAYLITGQEGLETRVRARLEVADPGYARKIFVRTLGPMADVRPDLLDPDREALEAASQEAAREASTTPSNPDAPFTVAVVVDLGDEDAVSRSPRILHLLLGAMEDLRRVRPATMRDARVLVLALWPTGFPDTDRMIRLWAWVKEVNFLVHGRFERERLGEAIPDESATILGRAGGLSDLFLIGPTNYHAERNPEGLKTLVPAGDRTLQWNCAAEVLAQLILKKGLDEALYGFPPDAKTGLYAVGASSVGFTVEPVRQAFAAHRLSEMIQTYLESRAQEPPDDEVKRGLSRASTHSIMGALVYGGFDRTQGNPFESIFSRLVMDFKTFLKPTWVSDHQWSLELPYRILHHRDILGKTHYEEAHRKVEEIRDDLRSDLTHYVDEFVDRYVGVVGERGGEGPWRIERARAALRKARFYLIRQIEALRDPASAGLNEEGKSLDDILGVALRPFDILRDIRYPKTFVEDLYDAIASLFQEDLDRKRLWREVEEGPGVVDRYYEEFVQVVRNQPLPEAVWLRTLALGFPLAVGCSFGAEVHQYGLPIPLLNLGWFGVPAVVFPVVAGAAVAAAYSTTAFWRRKIRQARDRLIIAILKDFRRRLRDEILAATGQILDSLVAHVGDPDDLQNRDPESIAARLDDWRAALANAERELHLRSIQVPEGVESPFFQAVEPPEDRIGYGGPLETFDRFEETEWLIGSPEVRAFSGWRELARNPEGFRQAVGAWTRAVAGRGYGYLDGWPLVEVLKRLSPLERGRIEQEMKRASFPFLDVPPDRVGSLTLGEAVVCEPDVCKETTRLFPTFKDLPMAPLSEWKAISRLRVFGGLTWRLIPAVEGWRSRYLALSMDDRSALHACPEFADDCLDPLESMRVTYPPVVPVTDVIKV